MHYTQLKHGLPVKVITDKTIHKGLVWQNDIDELAIIERTTNDVRLTILAWKLVNSVVILPSPTDII